MNTPLLWAVQAIVKLHRYPYNRDEGEKLADHHKIRGMMRWLLCRRWMWLYMLVTAVFIARFCLRTRFVPGKSMFILQHAAANEARQIDFIKKLFPSYTFSELTEYPGGKSQGRLVWLFFCAYVQFLWGASRRTVKILARLPYPPAHHVLTAILEYIFYKKLFMRLNCPGILTTNDTAARSNALVAAAKMQGRTTFYIQHAHISTSFPRLIVDVAILDGAAARVLYDAIGKHTARVLYRGVEGEYRHLHLENLHKEKICVGLFINTLPDPPVMQALAALDALDFVEKIIVRYHPAFPCTIDFSSEKFSLSDMSRTPWADGARCDLVLAGNSSVHLNLVKYGVPCVYLENLDPIGDDYYGFVAAGLLPRVQDASLLNLMQVITHYNKPQWVETMQYFDASYGKDAAILQDEIRQALRQGCY
jgi:hypothetical protein